MCEGKGCGRKEGRESGTFQDGIGVEDLLLDPGVLATDGRQVLQVHYTSYKILPVNTSVHRHPAVL